LVEARRSIDEKIALIKRHLKVEAKTKEEAEKSIACNYHSSGICWKLREAFDNFCPSLDPEFGQRGGVSITCDADHRGYYPEYDPEFAIFKDCVEGSYSKVHFRAEASTETSRISNQKEYVVEFWPIQGSDLQKDKSTWGEKHVSDEYI
jgi:hypothetical protein